MRSEPDALVIGAGPSGLAAAISMARLGLHVQVVDRQHPKRRPGEIIDDKALELLGKLGIDKAAVAKCLAPTLSFWSDAAGAEQDPTLSLNRRSYAVDDSALAQELVRVCQQAGVTVTVGVGKISVDLAAPRAQWRDMTVRPGFLVMAGGRQMSLGDGRDRRDRLVAIMTMEASARDRLMIDAAEDGWWFAAPCAVGGRVISYMTDADFVPTGVEKRAAWLTARWSNSLLAVPASEPPRFQCTRAFPASTSTLHTLYGQRWIAVGDAASSLDPLCGFGIAAAIAKGEALARLAASQSLASGFARYAATERETFETFDDHRIQFYRQARLQDRTGFWQRR